MFSFSRPSGSPAMKSHLDAQMTFFADCSKKMIDGIQKLTALNVQVAKALLDESAANSKQMLSSTNQNEVFSILAGQSQPALEKIRAYQQHVRQICANTQVDVTRSIQSYVPETTRAAEAVVKEVAQKASEETAAAKQRQQQMTQKSAATVRDDVERATESVAAKATNHK